MRYIVFCCSLLVCFNLQAQESLLTPQLYDAYEKYRESSLDKRRIKHRQLLPLMEELSKDPNFEINTVGRSIEGRILKLISIGKGDVDVFLWSQMHGNEPTATQAIFDLINFLQSEDFQEEKSEILSNLRLHFLPMLNPDGAEVYARRNTLGIDINRDALRLQSPEGQTLKRVRDSLDAEFGFNLHDQSTYYNAERTSKPATISYLAPPYNYEKDINEVRANAMKVIAYMNGIIQQYAPGQVGRYSDDFEPRAFGDNIQKWGTSAILIESGGYPNDAEKQQIRKLNFVSILSAIYVIATGQYNDISLEDYWIIPENDRKLFDLKIESATYMLLGKPYLLDIGIYRMEVDNEDHSDFWIKSAVGDQGDLSTYFGYETFDASSYTIRPGKVYPEQISDIADLDQNRVLSLLKEGYLYARIKQVPEKFENSPVPMNIISGEYELPDFRVGVGTNPSFYLEKDGKLEYAIINGFLTDLKEETSTVKNGLIFR